MHFLRVGIRSAIGAAVMFLACVAAGAQPRPQQVPQPPPDHYQTVLRRLELMTSLPINQWRFHTGDIPHGESTSINDANWVQANLTGGSGPAAGNGWYRAWIELPPLAGGKDIRGARVQLVLRASSPVRVFFNGSMVAQENSEALLPIPVIESAVPGTRILVAVSTSRLSGGQLSVEYPGQPDPGMLRQEIQSSWALMTGFPSGNADRMKQLDAVVASIDLNALDHGDQQAFTASLQAANHALEPIHDWMKQFSVRAVGNAHIDMAWLWPWTETVEVVRNTYTTVLQLMREYPGFTYTQSSAQTFAWMEEKYPDLFSQIQQRVKEGRWEIVGGMWVEPDLNMPDGESLVRQILVGKRYFQQKFGVDVNVGWNPDSFGYNWQLPQIYKKSGFDSFVTQKISWNETTVFPYKLFWWQAPDGSRVLTYFPHNYVNGIEPVRIASDIATYAPATGFPELMHLYGVGDHGGGPTRVMLDELQHLQDPSAAFPPISFSTARGFFDDVNAAIQKGDLRPPVWNDELYLEYHRGCYTTQSETKKLIRQSEELLQNAEKFASISYLAQQTYPQSELESSWKKLLFDHFHDIMPGSGIAVNYLDAARNLHEVGLAGENVLHGALDEIAARANTSGTGFPVVVFNPLSWERNGEIVAELPQSELAQSWEARDSSGQLLPVQVISIDHVARRARLRVMARAVPPLGYEVIHLVPNNVVRSNSSPLKATGTTLENKFVKLTVDPQTGCITTLINKADGKNILPAGGCGNLLQTFLDKPARQDAWEIKFDEQSWDLKQPQEVRLVESGPVRAVIRVKNKFQSSTFVQDITLFAGVPRVDVDTQVDWHEHHILLKVAVPVDVQTNFATYEIPYGTIQRPTTRNTPAEQAKFEVPALRWGDLSDSARGLSLLNASKYGYDAKGNVIRLSLLRSPTYPNAREDDPNGVTDQGLHEFTYSLYPHTGNWESGGTMRQAYELNYPLIALATIGHDGVLPAKRSFARIDRSNVILTVVKKAEDEDALVFRFYEFAGKQTDVRLHLPQSAQSAAEMNLMEKDEHPLSLSSEGTEVLIPTGPYEIKTVKIKFPPHGS